LFSLLLSTFTLHTHCCVCVAAINNQPTTATNSKVSSQVMGETVTIIKCGSMFKRSQNKKRFTPVNYKWRWFELSRSFLIYYDNFDGTKEVRNYAFIIKLCYMLSSPLGPLSHTCSSSTTRRPNERLNEPAIPFDSLLLLFHSLLSLLVDFSSSSDMRSDTQHPSPGLSACLLL